jgi:hypothetical protein
MKQLMFILFIALTLCVAVAELVSRIEYSSGDRYGVIYKVSKSGIFFKTIEGEMMLSGTQSGNPWEFSVKNSVSDEDKKVLLAQLELAASMNVPVKIGYKQSLFSLPWNGKTPYFIQSIEQIERGQLK